MGGCSGGPASTATGGLSCSISTTAGNSSRISSARSGQRAAYSSKLGRSPRRHRARNDSSSCSTESRPEPVSLIIGIPRRHLPETTLLARKPTPADLIFLTSLFCYARRLHGGRGLLSSGGDARGARDC